MAELDTGRTTKPLCIQSKAARTLRAELYVRGFLYRIAKHWRTAPLADKRFRRIDGGTSGPSSLSARVSQTVVWARCVAHCLAHQLTVIPGADEVIERTVKNAASTGHSGRRPASVQRKSQSCWAALPLIVSRPSESLPTPRTAPPLMRGSAPAADMLPYRLLNSPKTPIRDAVGIGPRFEVIDQPHHYQNAS